MIHVKVNIKKINVIDTLTKPLNFIHIIIYVLDTYLLINN